MVGARGQSMSEFVIMLALLTVVGLVIMQRMLGTSANPGAIDSMAQHASDKIVADKD